MYTDNIIVLNAVTATTTSDKYDVSKRSTVGIQLIAASVSSGNGVFTVDVSNNGTDWIPSVAMQDVQGTNSTALVTSKTLNSNTSVGMYFPQNSWQYIRVKVTRTTDGTYTAILQSHS